MGYSEWINTANKLRGGDCPIEGSSADIAEILSEMFESVEEFEAAYNADAWAVGEEVEARLAEMSG